MAVTASGGSEIVPVFLLRLEPRRNHLQLGPDLQQQAYCPRRIEPLSNGMRYQRECLLTRNPQTDRKFTNNQSSLPRWGGTREPPVLATSLLPSDNAAACVIKFDIATGGISMQFKGRVSQGDLSHRIKSPSQRDPRGVAVDLKRVRCAA
jgi:hypothetical protein